MPFEEVPAARRHPRKLTARGPGAPPRRSPGQPLYEGARPVSDLRLTNGEIGDICNASQGTITGGNGATYTVQKEWSNALGSCIAHK